MSESVLAASDFSLETSWKQAEKGTLSPFECLSFANTIQADLQTCVFNIPFFFNIHLYMIWHYISFETHLPIPTGRILFAIGITTT